MKKLTTMFIAFLIAIQFVTIESYAGTAGLPPYVKDEVIYRFRSFIDEYNVLLSGVWGFFMASSVLIFIIHFIKLGQWSHYPMVREKIMNDLMVTGICTAILGSFGFFYYLITTLVLK